MVQRDEETAPPATYCCARRQTLRWEGKGRKETVGTIKEPPVPRLLHEKFHLMKEAYMHSSIQGDSLRGRHSPPATPA